LLVSGVSAGTVAEKHAVSSPASTAKAPPALGGHHNANQDTAQSTDSGTAENDAYLHQDENGIDEIGSVNDSQNKEGDNESSTDQPSDLAATSNQPTSGTSEQSNHSDGVSVQATSGTSEQSNHSDGVSVQADSTDSLGNGG
jgi:hypothetical protein